ncbi:hypothetical protein M9H77_05550 [Catharanthus roseus]|uniref:Uncharacterized protein n=1 Tax=Catharanthus roseus TaxID=4058 RepID=A0ACC0CH68_CATRO|nr:hypothetical protein M9H77_05550 [Catharanthus roseus]
MGGTLFNLKKQWRRRRSRNYKRLDSTIESRKNIKIVRFGGNPKRVWKIRKIRVKLASPIKLWQKFKTAYMNMMMNFSGNIGALNSSTGNNANVFGGGGGKRIMPKGDNNLGNNYDKTQFENRLIYEIYKSLVVSMELNPSPPR